MKLTPLVVATIGMCAVSHADSLKSVLDAQGKAISKAMMAKDFVRMEKLLKASMTADFTYSEDGRKQSRDEMIAGMKMGISSLKKVTVCDSIVVTVKQTGDTAIATTKRSMGGITPGPDKKDHVSVYSGLTTDTYVKLGGKWMLKTMSWKTTSMTMDGKPFDPTKMGAPAKGK